MSHTNNTHVHDSGRRVKEKAGFSFCCATYKVVLFSVSQGVA